MTSVGVIHLRVPKVRHGSCFPEDLIVRYSRVGRAVIAAVSEMVTSGVSTRKVELPEEAETDALAHLDFPYAHHRRLRTNNVQECASRELKGRSRVVQVFPSRKSLIRMLGAVFVEMDEDRATRRWFAEESIAQASASTRPAAPAPKYEGTAEEHARRTIDVVVADNPIGRRTV